MDIEIKKITVYEIQHKTGRLSIYVRLSKGKWLEFNLTGGYDVLRKDHIVELEIAYQDSIT